VNVVRALVALVELGARVYRAVRPRPAPPVRRTLQQVKIDRKVWADPK
jgi:hypothetical protein